MVFPQLFRILIIAPMFSAVSLLTFTISTILHKLIILVVPRGWSRNTLSVTLAVQRRISYRTLWIIVARHCHRHAGDCPHSFILWSVQRFCILYLSQLSSFSVMLIFKKSPQSLLFTRWLSRVVTLKYYSCGNGKTLKTVDIRFYGGRWHESVLHNDERRITSQWLL